MCGTLFIIKPFLLSAQVSICTCLPSCIRISHDMLVPPNLILKETIRSSLESIIMRVLGIFVISCEVACKHAMHFCHTCASRAYKNKASNWICAVSTLRHNMAPKVPRWHGAKSTQVAWRQKYPSGMGLVPLSHVLTRPMSAGNQANDRLSSAHMGIHGHRDL